MQRKKGGRDPAEGEEESESEEEEGERGAQFVTRPVGTLPPSDSSGEEGEDEDEDEEEEEVGDATSQMQL